MVQSLNWNNYSPNQILELKKTGVEVPEKVYKNAQAALSENDSKEVTAQSKDDAKVSYNIENTADQKNEAKELRAQLEAEGESLKGIVSKFTEKSAETTKSISETMKEIEGFVSYISINEAEAKVLTDAANDETAVVIEIIEENNAEVEKKMDELDFLNEKIEEGTATEAEQAQAETVAGEVGTISNKTSGKVQDKIATADNFNSKAATINSNLQDVANKTGKALNNAKDAIELADETKDVSKKLYDKGMKTRKIAMAIGSVLGGVGGFFAGRAISNKINGNMLANRGITKSVNSGGTTYSSYTKSFGQINSAIKTEKMTSIIGKAGGALAGASLGLALGSLFGGESIEMGETGMATADKLKDVSNQTKSISEKVAAQNNISIAEANVADASVSKFDLAVSDISDNVDKNIKDAQVTEAPETAEDTNTGNSTEDDPTKKKPVA